MPLSLDPSTSHSTNPHKNNPNYQINPNNQLHLPLILASWKRRIFEKFLPKHKSKGYWLREVMAQQRSESTVARARVQFWAHSD